MARVGLEDSWVVHGDIGSVQDALLEFLGEQNMRVVEESDGKILAKQGSHFLTRLLGGWFVASKRLPKRATLRVRKTEKGIEVRAIIEESLGVGFLDPILKEKYQKHFDAWMDDLEDFLKELDRDRGPRR